jgi:hypothetical protein
MKVEEQEVSEQRRNLHVRIDALRSQLESAPAPGPQAKEKQLETPGRAYLAAMQIGFGSLARDDS